MTLELAESLLLAEAISPRALARGLFLEATQQMPLVQALLATGAIDEAKLEAALARPGEPPPLGTITPSLSLAARLPRGLCARLLAVPIGTDADTGAIDVALVDDGDIHAATEVAFFLRANVRVHRATASALRAAVEQLQAAAGTESEAPALERSRTPIWGTPVVSVVPQQTPHAAPAEMAIPLMRRSATPPPPVGRDDSAVLELRTPASSRGVAGPDTERSEPPDAGRREPSLDEPVFALKPPGSLRRPVAVMIAETQLQPNAAVTIPAPRDPRHSMVTAPAPARRSEPPPKIELRRSSLPRIASDPPQAGRRQTSMPPASLGAPRLPFPDAGPVLAAMDEANDRDAIIALLISGMRVVARRAAIMAVKRDAFVGWSCNAEFGDARAWRGVQVSTDVPSVLATAAAGTPYLGPLFRTDGHMPILEFMREVSRDVAVIGVRVDMHPALVLIADELGDTALGTKRLEQLAKAAGASLARVLRKK
ncbi:MAG TPA: hypothetical protein VGH28_11295 [Polyangiaceae bacterium]